MDHSRYHRQLIRAPAWQAGLTLIELLVAISVLAFVAVLGWRGLDTIVRTRLALNSDLAQTRGLQLAFAQLQTDCTNIANPAQLPGRPPIAIDRDQLMLVRTVFAENQPTRLQVVTYRVQNGVLTRQESAATRDLAELNRLWLAAGSGFDAANAVVLQTGVASMMMRLWDGRGWRTDNPSPQTAASTGSQASPGAAEGQVPIVTAGTSAPPTGLEVALRLDGREASLLKILLLGAV